MKSQSTLLQTNPTLLNCNFNWRTTLVTAVATTLICITAHSARATVIMDQIGPDSSFTSGQNAGTSQRFEAGLTDFDAALLDDFIVTNDSTLTTLDAVVALGGAATFGDVQNFAIEIYSSPAAAQFSLLGDIASVSVASPDSNLAFGINSLLSFDLSGQNIMLNPGTYYIALVGRLDFNGTDENSFAIPDSIFAGTPGNSNNAHANPGEGFFAGGLSFPGNNSAYRLTANVIPEPSRALLTLLGIGAVLGRRRW